MCGRGEGNESVFISEKPGTNTMLSRYLLTITSCQPLYGKLSDIFGRKPALLFGYAIFGIGCLFCGLARNIEELIAARVGNLPVVSKGLWMSIC